VDNNSGRITDFARLTTMFKAFKRSLAVLISRDEGDVPGWVLITLMTAGLVVIIWALAGPALSGVFQQAIQRVTGF
jgi:hypothetical protein